MVLKESDSELDRGDAAPDFELPGTDGEVYGLDSFAEFDTIPISMFFVSEIEAVTTTGVFQRV